MNEAAVNDALLDNTQYDQRNQADQQMGIDMRRGADKDRAGA